MLNQDKFKTPEERVKAFEEFCKSRDCEDCTICKRIAKDTECWAHWLALEAEEEKPEPCPFCGESVTINDFTETDGCNIICNKCGYTSCEGQDHDDAIAAHNRVARAVRAASEGEVK